MDKLDPQTLIHVGVELVVVAGITFWLNRRISSVQGEVGQLNEKLAEFEKVIAQQAQLLHRHEQILNQIFGGSPSGQIQSAPSPQHAVQQSRSPRRASQTSRAPPTLPPKRKLQPNPEFQRVSQMQPQPQSQPQPVIQTIIDNGESEGEWPPEPPGKELDGLLENELNGLESFSGECEDEELCELKEYPLEVKKKD